MLRVASCLMVVALFVSTAQAVEIETVPVGNPGNAPDMRYNLYQRPEGYGAVSDAYNIGKYEVTAGQYRDFLNAVDPTGANAVGLYNPWMNEHFDGCQITWNSTLSTYDFSGGTVEAPGSTAVDWENRPVNYVGFWDAARFANWLHNGQDNGDTESGAYHDIDNQTLFGRNAGARFFIPTEDEWYKAAYHDRNAGLAATYFKYPASNDGIPGRDISEETNPGNNANYWDGRYVIGSPYWRTEVGAFELSDSPYGTFDQGGNVQEWNETAGFGSSRLLRGGEWSYYYHDLRADQRTSCDPLFEGFYLGFRVASVPEPGSITLLVCGLVAGLIWWRRRK